MTNQYHPDNPIQPFDLLQASWLKQSSLVGHPIEQVRHYADALIIYNKVIEIAPDNVLAHLLQGRALDNLERADEAKFAYTHALNLARHVLRQQPDNEHALVYQADALWMLDQENEAMASYNKAIDLSSTYAEAFINRGWRFFADNRLEDALRDYEQALRLQPDNADTLYREGCVFWDLSRYNDALEAAEQALLLDPTSPRAYGLKITTLSYMGREEEAKLVDAQYQSLLKQMSTQY